VLIAMAVFDTKENKRTQQTEETLWALKKTVNFTRHRLFVCDNGSCDETMKLYERMHNEFLFEVIENKKNLGTAVAINRAWAKREPGEHCVKMDNDVTIHESDWPDLMEFVFAKEPKIGICGLKRKDIWESPDTSHGEYYRSTLELMPHEPGERWIIVEDVNHVIGTCQAYSSLLLDEIGYLYQMQDQGNLYGFDDSLASLRAEIAGFRRVFLPHISIDHIDPGGTEFTDWKKVNAGDWMGAYHKARDEYKSGERSIFYQGP